MQRATGRKSLVTFINSKAAVPEAEGMRGRGQVTQGIVWTLTFAPPGTESH